MVLFNILENWSSELERLLVQHAIMCVYSWPMAFEEFDITNRFSIQDNFLEMFFTYVENITTTLVEKIEQSNTENKTMEKCDLRLYF